MHYEPPENQALPPSTRNGAGYDLADSLKRIEERYATAFAWRYSLEQFLTDERGRDAYTALRGDGWLDWQIFVTIVNIGINWRLEREDVELTPANARVIALRGEKPDDELLPVEVILERLDSYLFVQLASVAKVSGVYARPARPGSRELRRLLERRYHYAEDDIPHTDPLDSLEDEGRLRQFVPTPER